MSDKRKVYVWDAYEYVWLAGRTFPSVAEAKKYVQQYLEETYGSDIPKYRLFQYFELAKD